jgi:beta-xylosidase
MVKSRDLQHWESVGKVLVPPAEERGGSFWAPEVAFHDGVFYLYYQCNGNGRGFHIRVAASEAPEGPYRDVGAPLTDVAKNPFAIDAHPFRDDDGQWYLFYATDFLDSDGRTFRGTALVVDRMKSMTALEGAPQVVMRAHWQWQCFQRNRDMYGTRADWYTLEGPAVRKRDGRYYCFYSGGCYENDTYGVDYLVADRVLGPWEEIGRERGPQVTRTIPGKVVGPGHCSIVSAADGERDFIVYHAWDLGMSRRQMWIDPLIWTPDGPMVARFEGAG